jgi:predicted aspartyl protease
MRIFAAALLLSLSALAHAGASAWVPLEISNGHLLMDVTINGQPAKALLDTGATGNGISEDWLARNKGEFSRGRYIKLQGIKEDYETTEINGLKVGMFGTEIDLNSLWPMHVEGADLIIGVPFFNLFVVQIDYPGQRLRIVDHDSLDLRKFSNVEMEWSTSTLVPMVQVDLNGEMKAWLDLDTGNNGGIVVKRNKAEKLGWLQRFSAKEGLLTGTSGEAARTESFSLPTMTVGPFEMENVTVTVPAEGEHLYLTTRASIERQTGTRIKRGKQSDGLLGYDVLQHFIVSIDYRRELVNFDVPR